MQRLPKVKTEKTMQKWLDWNTLSPKELLRKSCVSVMVIGNSVIHGLRRYPVAWRTFFSWYKTINLGIGGDRAENVLWFVNDIAVPKSVTSVVIHCGTNNINTTNSDEISLGFSKNHLWNRNWTFPVKNYYTWKLEFFSNILWMIVDSSHIVTQYRGYCSWTINKGN